MVLLCKVCGEPYSFERTLGVTITGLETELSFTEKSADEKTVEDIDAEIAFYARYKEMYGDNITEIDRRVSDLNILKVGK